ncbi:MAG: hypothetical protein RBS96_08760 [Dehalococcoidales bacterium]|jgi:hypothetical protein|nr:hypothetical protein [Dehalococcoidales bacterium]
MKWLIWSISLLLLSCGDEQMAKPSLRGIWARGGTRVDVTSMADTGFQKTALEYAKLNGILYQQGEWADFTDRAFGKTYYVQCTSGDDSTGDGSETYPFATIKKACDSIEDGGYGDIVLDETGTYNVDEYITLNSKKIRITEGSAVTAEIQFDSYTDASTENNLYKFVLRNSFLLISCDTITIDAPADAGNDWNNTTIGGFGVDAFAGAIYSAEGLNYALIDADVDFSATPATGGFPCLFYQEIPSILSISYTGTITTNDQGYIIGYYDPDHAPVTIISNGNYTIDNPLFRVLNGATAINQKLSTGDMGGSPAAFKIKLAAGSLLTTYETASLPDTTTDADIKTAIETLLNTNSNTGGIEVTVTTTRDGGSGVTELTIEISGSYSGSRIYSDLLYIGTGEECYLEEIQAPRPYGYNIITN